MAGFFPGMETVQTFLLPLQHIFSLLAATILFIMPPSFLPSTLTFTLFLLLFIFPQLTVSSLQSFSLASNHLTHFSSPFNSIALCAFHLLPCHFNMGNILTWVNIHFTSCITSLFFSEQQLFVFNFGTVSNSCLWLLINHVCELYYQWFCPPHIVLSSLCSQHTLCLKNSQYENQIKCSSSNIYTCKLLQVIFYCLKWLQEKNDAFDLYISQWNNGDFSITSIFSYDSVLKHLHNSVTYFNFVFPWPNLVLTFLLDLSLFFCLHLFNLLSFLSPESVFKNLPSILHPNLSFSFFFVLCFYSLLRTYIMTSHLLISPSSSSLHSLSISVYLFAILHYSFYFYFVPLRYNFQFFSFTFLFIQTQLHFIAFISKVNLLSHFCSLSFNSPFSVLWFPFSTNVEKSICRQYLCISFNHICGLYSLFASQFSLDIVFFSYLLSVFYQCYRLTISILAFVLTCTKHFSCTVVNYI